MYRRRDEKSDFPDKEIVIASYTYNLAKLVRLAGLEDDLNRSMEADLRFSVSWGTVKDWDVQSRYEEMSAAVARDMYKEDDWRLILVTSLVDSRGPLATYAMVQRALAKAQLTSELSLRKISVMGPNDPLIKTLRTALRTGPGMHSVRVTKNVIDNAYIEDVLVYRLL